MARKFWFCLAIVLSASLLRAAAPIDRAAVDFTRDIQPLLSDNCYACHGPDEKERKGKLRLDTKEGAFRIKDGQAVIVPGKSTASELYRRLTTKDEDDHMPPAKSKRHLTSQQIELVRRWIDQGASWAQHWAYQTPQRPPLPNVNNRRWPKNAIDYFILARLEREELKPSLEATKETLIRRVTLDLTGLPPTLQEVDEFLADKSPNAYEKVVDRLLKSPRYGERMVWEWMDAARYADSNGYQGDQARTMWPWRDWVIEAFNRNLPFDQFTIEQLAGDLQPGAALSQKIATGFNRNHALNGEGGRIAEESRVEYVVDRVDTTATVWLGLTMGCARCHDHKFDPFTQKEYFQLFAYFNNVTETGSVDNYHSAKPVLPLPTSGQKEKMDVLNKAISELEPSLKTLKEKLTAGQIDWERQAVTNSTKVPTNIVEILKLTLDKRSDGQKKELSDHYLSTVPEWTETKKKLDAAKNSLEEHKKALVYAMVMEERDQPRETHILIRGDYEKPGAKVSAGVPASLPPLPDGVPTTRLGLATWLVDPANPLTARVTVNRYWLLFFGTGLVKTAEDFGVQGEAPSHPDLLDWLATEFIRCGWDVKALHKLLVMSATYRQVSKVTPELLERDPQNRLLARGSRYRLPSFMIRDQALALSGLLVEKAGGPPVKPYQPDGVWEDMSYGKITYQRDQGENLYRRSLYTFWRRTAGPPAMFDSSTRQVCTVRTPRTNTPLQSLALLNDVTYVEAARVFGERLVEEAGKTPEQRITKAFRLATSREATAGEMKVLLQAYQRFQRHFEADKEAALKLVGAGESPRDAKLDPTELAAYTSVANLLLNLDEVLNKP